MGMSLYVCNGRSVIRALLVALISAAAIQCVHAENSCLKKFGTKEWPGLFSCCFAGGIPSVNSPLKIGTMFGKDNAVGGKFSRETLRLIEKADGLMRQRTVKSAQEAADLYRIALKEDPNDIDLKLKAADALNCVMRIQTCANTILIEGSLDTQQNRKIWSTFGPDALQLAKSAYKERSNDVRALAIYTDAFVLEGSSKGLIQQALTGAGNEYKRLSHELMKFPQHDSAVGHALLGAFYQCAPWPVGSKELAMKNMDEAVKLAPSRRNLYYQGVVAFHRNELAKAENAFKAALTARFEIHSVATRAIDSCYGVVESAVKDWSADTV